VEQRTDAYRAEDTEEAPAKQGFVSSKRWQTGLTRLLQHSLEGLTWVPYGLMIAAGAYGFQDCPSLFLEGYGRQAVDR
jgi:hypothetical protein